MAQIPGKIKNYLLQIVQLCSGSYPASYSVQSRCSFSRGKAEGDLKLQTHSQPVPKLRTSVVILPLPHTSSWRAQGLVYLYLWCGLACCFKFCSIPEENDEHLIEGRLCYLGDSKLAPAKICRLF